MKTLLLHSLLPQKYVKNLWFENQTEKNMWKSETQLHLKNI